MREENPRSIIKQRVCRSHPADSNRRPTDYECVQKKNWQKKSSNLGYFSELFITA